MGADLIMQRISFRSGCDIDEEEKKMLRHLKTMRIIKKDWEEFFDACGLEYTNDEELKEEAADRIKNLFGGLRGARDVTSINYPEREIYITGGMSWGDEPTGSYGNFSAVNAMPEELQKVGGINQECEIYELFMAQYKKKLPKTLKNMLKRWRLIEAL